MSTKQDRPDSLTLAGYIDGRLDEAARKEVERWLADSPDGIDLLRSVRRSLSTPAPMAPDSLVRNAAALVPEAAAVPAVVAHVRFWNLFYWPSTAALVRTWFQNIQPV